MDEVPTWKESMNLRRGQRGDLTRQADDAGHSDANCRLA
jgi:hypothetical protein